MPELALSPAPLSSQPKPRQPYIHPSASSSFLPKDATHGSKVSHSWKDVPLHPAGEPNGESKEAQFMSGREDAHHHQSPTIGGLKPAGSINRRPSVSLTAAPPSLFGGGARRSLSSPPSSPSFLSSLSQTLREFLPSSSSPSSSPHAIITNIKFVFLCSLWYMSSAVSSNTGKAIFNVFKFPVTLTLVQFIFIAFFSWAWTRPVLGMGKLRQPSKALLKGVLPMAAFQVGGHVFSSVATSRVPVSTVHTIKALSPLFTVLSYRFLFNVSYSSATYTALIPLTLGVMFACSFDVSASNVFGLICAFGSTLVFVSSNIFFKKIVPSSSNSSGVSSTSKEDASSTSGRLDKINLLFYSSSLAFLFMVPLWLYSDLHNIIADSARRASMQPPPSDRTRAVLYYFVLNGSSHFLQNVLAFNILSSTSPVTYSIASLVKRIVVILMAIVWFNQRVHPVQAMGIGLTFVGLYMYQNAKGEVDKMEKKVRKIEAIREGSFLPSSTEDAYLMTSERMHGKDGGSPAEKSSSFGTTTRLPNHNAPTFLPPPPLSSGGSNPSLRNHHPT